MEGPAFSTRAESLINHQLGFDVIGMTNLGEAKCAREAEIAYATLAMSTDYDCWKEDEHVTLAMIIQNLHRNADMAKKIVAARHPANSPRTRLALPCGVEKCDSDRQETLAEENRDRTETNSGEVSLGLPLTCAPKPIDLKSIHGNQNHHQTREITGGRRSL